MPASIVKVHPGARLIPRLFRRCRGAVAACIGSAVLLAGAGALFAKPLPIPGYSFESPTTTFVSTQIDYWQNPPKPPDYDESGGFLWSQLTGLFVNTPVGASDHLDNCDGAQAAYLFAVPQVAVFQDFASMDYAHTSPQHAFGVQYQTGKAYILTVGLNGGGGGMLEGVTLLLSFYYRGDAGNPVTIATTTVTYTAATFPNHTHLTDFQVRTPFVVASDPWAGRHIGIQLLSNVSDALQGGYWDMDNFRLEEIPDTPTIAAEGSNVRVTWASYPGYLYQLQTSPDLHTWTPFGMALAGTGSNQSALYPLGSAQTFFRLFLSPAAPGPIQLFSRKTALFSPMRARPGGVHAHWKN